MIDFRIQRSWSRNGTDIWLIDRQNNRSFIAEPIELKFREMKTHEMLPEPTIFIDEMQGKEIFEAARKSFASAEWIDKDEWSAHNKIQKAMQAHIDSLKLVVDRTVK